MSTFLIYLAVGLNLVSCAINVVRLRVNRRKYDELDALAFELMKAIDEYHHGAG